MDKAEQQYFHHKVVVKTESKEITHIGKKKKTYQKGINVTLPESSILYANFMIWNKITSSSWKALWIGALVA